VTFPSRAPARAASAFLFTFSKYEESKLGSVQIGFVIPPLELPISIPILFPFGVPLFHLSMAVQNTLEVPASRLGHFRFTILP
jgi:hypothetical protein